MVAALFALHPINVESVAWIAERKNLLSMFFFLLTLGAYRWYAQKPKDTRYVVVALLFALGLMSKPQVITLPFVLLLWDYWPLQRFSFGAASLGGEPARDSANSQTPLSTLIWEKVPLFLSLCHERGPHHAGASGRRSHQRLCPRTSPGKRHHFLRAIYGKGLRGHHSWRCSIRSR